MFLQIVIGECEVVVAEKPGICRQRRGVGRCQHQMAFAVDKCSFALGIAAPEYEYEVFSFLGKNAYGCVCKLLPSASLMRTGISCTHCEGRIQQQ